MREIVQSTRFKRNYKREKKGRYANSGLAVALAVSHFTPQTAIAGTLFSIWHNITGPLLASIWRRKG